MSAQILDGKALAAKLKEELKAEVVALKRHSGKHPRLVSIVIGDDAASQSYALSQQRTAEGIGIHYELQKLSADVLQADVLELIRELNGYPEVHGVIINKPVPKRIDFKVLVDAITPDKDVEGLTLVNLGRLLLGRPGMVPCTAAAAMAHIKAAMPDLKGRQAVVLGRSEIVGKPAALLLLKENATVTVCHSQTVDLPGHVRAADVVIAAVGRKHFVQGDWIKPGAVVIDVGINDDNGKITGDVDFEACSKKAGYITPVPGGVGPVTSVMLMGNAIQALKRQLGLPQ